MKLLPVVLHAAVSLALGTMLSLFTPAKWFAASFWVSAVLFFIGSLGVFEDALPGGFENPDGSVSSPIVKGTGALLFWAQALTTVAVLVAVGVALQFLTSAS